MTAITFQSSGLSGVIDSMRRFSGDSNVAAARAINYSITSARRNAVDEMYRQVEFPKGYLGNANDSNARLAITEKASADNLEGVISARHRPTSLARFMQGGGSRPGDVRVSVKSGAVSTALRSAFVVRLRSGASITEDDFNLGLAVRLKAGDSLRNSRGAVRMASGLYLLYGPSVDQVFQTVREDVAPQAVVDLRGEYIRQMNLRGI